MPCDHTVLDILAVLDVGKITLELTVLAKYEPSLLGIYKFDALVSRVLDVLCIGCVSTAADRCIGVRNSYSTAYDIAVRFCVIVAVLLKPAGLSYVFLYVLSAVSIGAPATPVCLPLYVGNGHSRAAVLPKLSCGIRTCIGDRYNGKSRAVITINYILVNNAEDLCVAGDLGRVNNGAVHAVDGKSELFSRLANAKAVFVIAMSLISHVSATAAIVSCRVSLAVVDVGHIAAGVVGRI